MGAIKSIDAKKSLQIESSCIYEGFRVTRKRRRRDGRVLVLRRLGVSYEVSSEPSAAIGVAYGTPMRREARLLVEIDAEVVRGEVVHQGVDETDADQAFGL